MDHDVRGHLRVGDEHHALPREGQPDDIAVSPLRVDDEREGIRAERHGDVVGRARGESRGRGRPRAGDRARQLRGELGEVLQGTVLSAKIVTKGNAVDRRRKRRRFRRRSPRGERSARRGRDDETTSRAVPTSSGPNRRTDGAIGRVEARTRPARRTPPASKIL